MVDEVILPLFVSKEENLSRSLYGRSARETITDACVLLVLNPGPLRNCACPEAGQIERRELGSPAPTTER